MRKAIADSASGTTVSQRAIVRDTVMQVCLHDGRVEIRCATMAIASALGTIPPTLDVRLSRSGRVMRLVQDNGAALIGSANASLIKLVLKARRWRQILCKGELDISTLAAREGVNPAYITRVVRLAFLAPSITDATLAGTLRHGVDGVALTATNAIMPIWADQERTFLPGGI